MWEVEIAKLQRKLAEYLAYCKRQRVDLKNNMMLNHYRHEIKVRTLCVERTVTSLIIPARPTRPRSLPDGDGFDQIAAVKAAYLAVVDIEAKDGLSRVYRLKVAEQLHACGH